jgi:hypothetical protein
MGPDKDTRPRRLKANFKLGGHSAPFISQPRLIDAESFLLQFAAIAVALAYEAGKETVAKETYIRNFFAGAAELIHLWAQRFTW